MAQSDILELEYNYVKETAHQAIEDRYRMLNFYIGLCTAAATIVISVISLTKSNFSSEVALAISVLTLGISVVGWLFLAVMIRLRQAWYESVTAMNKIKDFYISNSEAKLTDAFLWEGKTIPKPERFWNIHFYSTLLIILLNTTFMGASILLVFSEAFSKSIYLPVLLPIFILSLFTQVLIYRIALKKGL